MGKRIRSENRNSETQTLILWEKTKRTPGQTLIYLLIISKMLFSNNTKMNRCAQSLPIVFVSALIGGLGLAFGYIFNTKLFDVRVNLSQDNLGGVAITFSILFYVNYVLIYWNYFMAICTDPGKIKKEWVSTAQLSLIITFSKSNFYQIATKNGS